MELGCGLGLCGILVAKLPSISNSLSVNKVVFTDRDEEVLEIVQKNIQFNDVQSVSHVERLEWGNVNESNYLLNQYTTSGIGFDVIIASDCLYNQGNAAAKVLFDVVNRLLINPRRDSSGSSKHNSTSNKNHNDVLAGDTSSEEGVEILPGDGGNWDKCDSELPSSHNTRAPVFILGYTRRVDGSDMSIQSLLSIADAYGFQWFIAEDSVLDMYGNVTSERTLFWEHCVFLFTRK